jgi:hypothetical protein
VASQPTVGTDGAARRHMHGRYRRSAIRILMLFLTSVTLGVPWMSGPPAAHAEEPAYVTLTFGRTQWVTTAACLPIPGTVPLDDVAAALGVRGFTGVGNVVVARTNETSRRCFNRDVQYASWTDLATLRDAYGWRFVSASQAYSNMTLLTPEQQYAASCGTLDTFVAHGHTSAWGMFAYPNNRYTDQIQADIVSTCFAFGRTYQRFLRNTAATSLSPWFQSTHTLAGGGCNITWNQCYTVAVAGGTRYQSPLKLAAFLAPAPGEWSVLQAYRFVVGAGSGGRFAWDCTNADWRLHWTNAVEMYCWNDYQYLLDHIPATVVVTDPASVASSWGRTLPSTSPAILTVGRSGHPRSKEGP